MDAVTSRASHGQMQCWNYEKISTFFKCPRVALNRWMMAGMTAAPLYRGLAVLVVHTDENSSTVVCPPVIWYTNHTRSVSPKTRFVSNCVTERRFKTSTCILNSRRPVSRSPSFTYNMTYIKLFGNRFFSADFRSRQTRRQFRLSVVLAGLPAINIWIYLKLVCWPPCWLQQRMKLYIRYRFWHSQAASLQRERMSRHSGV